MRLVEFFDLRRLESLLLKKAGIREKTHFGQVGNNYDRLKKQIEPTTLDKSRTKHP